ncbi:MAG: hypothetical protein J6J97_00710, partial [Akkermansia sp.]|nr:hypothetical protein [Akkermansia sp.]
MKLHLPKLLRNSVLACITAVTGIATSTVGTATFTGGVIAFTLASQQAQAANDLNVPTGGNFYGGDFSFDIYIADAGVMANGTSDLVAYYSGGSWADTYGSNGYVLTKDSEGVITLKVGRGGLSSSNAYDASMTFASGANDSSVFTTALQAGKVYTVKVTGGDQNQVVSLLDGETVLETATGYYGNMNGGGVNTTMTSALNPIYSAGSLYWKGSGEDATLADAANWQTTAGATVDDLSDKALVLYSVGDGAATTLSASGEVQLFTLGTQNYTVNVTGDLTINNGGLVGPSTFNVAENTVLKLVDTIASVKVQGAGKVQIGNGSKLSVYAGSWGNSSVSTAVEVLAGGILRLENSDSLGWGSQPVASVLLQGDSSNVATMQMTAKETLKSDVTLAGNARVTGGTFEFFGGKLIATGTNNIISSTIFSRSEQLSVDHTHIIQVTGADDTLEISGNFTKRSGENRIVKSGEGTLHLSYSGDADNTFYDGFTVQQGAVVLSGNATVSGSALVVEENASLTVSGSLTISQAIENAGELLFEEDGRIIVNATAKEGYVDATGATADNGFVGCENFQAIMGTIPQDFYVYLGNSAYAVGEDGMVTGLIDYSTYHMNSGEATLNAADVNAEVVIENIEHTGGILNIDGDLAVGAVEISGTDSELNVNGSLEVGNSIMVTGLGTTLTGNITIVGATGDLRSGLSLQGTGTYNAETGTIDQANVTVTGEDTVLTTTRLNLADNSGRITRLDITDGAVVTVNGTAWNGLNQDSFLLGHWSGHSELNVEDATLNVLEAGITVLDSHSAHLNVKNNGVVNIQALTQKGRSNTEKTVVTLEEGGMINIGKYGIASHYEDPDGVSGDLGLVINGGTLGILDSTTNWDTYKELTINGDLTINTELYNAVEARYTGDGGTIGLHGAVTTGENDLIKTGAGTLVLGTEVMQGSNLVVNEGYVELSAETGALLLGSLTTNGGAIVLSEGQTLDLGSAATGSITIRLKDVTFDEGATTKTVTVASGDNAPTNVAVEYFTTENVTASYSEGVITLTKSEDPLNSGPLTWKLAGETNTWASSTAKNWTSSNVDSRFVNGVEVIFGADASTVGENISIEGDVNITGMTVNGTGWTFGGSGNIGALGSGNIVVNTGKLTLKQGATAAFTGTGGYYFKDIAFESGSALEISKRASVVNSASSDGTYENLVLNDGTLSIIPASAGRVWTFKNLSVQGTSYLETRRLNKSYAATLNIQNLEGSGDLYLRSGSQTTDATVFTVSGATAAFSGNLHLVGNAATGNARRVTLNVNSEKALSQAVIHFDDSNNQNNLGFGVSSSEVTVAGLAGGVDGADSSLIIFSGTGTVSASEVASDSTVRTLKIATKADDTWSTSATVKGSLNLHKMGEGSQSFTGDMSAFNGLITVSGGTLNVASVGSASAFSITSAGATLGVTGEGQSITLSEGKSLTAVSGAVLDSALTLSGGTLELGTNETAWDTTSGLDLGGKTLTLSADNKTALTLHMDTTGLNGGDSFELFSNATLAGDLAADATLSTYFSGLAVNMANAALSFVDGKLIATLPTVQLESLVWGVVPGEGESVTPGVWADGTVFGVAGSGTFNNGDTAIFDAISGDDTVESVQISGAVEAASVTIDAGSGKTYSFTSVENGKLTTATLEVSSGTAQFGAGTIDPFAVSQYTVNGTLDLTAAYDISTSTNGKNKDGSFENFLEAMSGTGLVKIDADADAVVLLRDASLQVNLEVGDMRLNSYAASNESRPGSRTLTVSEGKTLTAATLTVETLANLKVNGGHLVADEIKMGHSGGGSGHYGKLYLEDGSITAGTISSYGQASNVFSMSGGTLELVGTSTVGENGEETVIAGSIAAGMDVDITGGTLKADRASWGISGATVGGVKITTSGENTITLTGGTLTGTIDNSAGKLAVGGAINITSEGYETITTPTRYSGANGNGYAVMDTSYVVASTVANLTVADGTTWTVDGTTAGSYADGAVTVAGSDWGTEYYIISGAETYSDISKTNDEGEALTAVVLDGNELNLDEALGAVLIKAAKEGQSVVTIGSGVTLASASTVTDASHQIKLGGGGTYALADGVATLGDGVVLGDWTGTVKVTNATGLTNFNVDTLAAFNADGTAKSTVELTGVSGHLTAPNVTYNANLKLTNDGETKALTLTNGWSANTTTFAGAISGSGSFVIATGTPSGASFQFTGNLSQWEGAFEQSSTGTTNLTIASTGTVGADLIRNDGTLKVTFTGADVVMNGDIGGEPATNTAMTNVTIAGGSSVALNGSVLAQGLTNNGTLSVGGNVSVATLTNAGTLNLTQDTTLAALDNTGRVVATGKNVILTGAVTGRGSISAGALTLQAATNTVGDLTLSGGLTLGTDVTSLTTGMLDIAGNVVVSKLGADMLTIGALTSGLDLSISEEELRAALTGSGITSLTLGSIQKLNGQTVTLVGLEELNKGQYSYSLDTTGGTLVLKVETNGLTWGGTADDDNKNWSDASNWDENIAPGGDSQPAVKFLGGGSSDVVIGTSSEVKHLTIDIAADAAVEEYTFTAAPGSDWNYLDVENNLSVNKGTLNVGAGVNIYSAGSTEVLAGGALNINQNAFVRALDGIDIAGDVMIDAYSGGGTTTNAGKLYVVNDGSISIAATGNVTVNGILSAVAGGTEKDKTADYEYDSLSYNANGSNITNAGTITSSGTIIACGDLTNSGSLTQTGGKLWVFGTLSNTSAASTETPDAGISIGGGETVLGALDNAGSLSVAGGSLSTGSLENSGALSISGGATVTVGAEGATDDTLENSGTITVGVDTEDTGSLVVNGSLVNSGADNNITVNAGSSLAVGGNLTADGMSLGFAGTVTVGGNARVDELTIKEGASFTANNANIGTLNNDGSLSVGKDVDGTLTGGDLSITTLTGSGDVNVGTDGTLSIQNDADFTGKINSEGAIVVSGEATLYTKTDNGGDITTTQLTVTEAANGSTMGTLTTGGIVIESMTTEAPSLNLDSIATNAADGTVAVTLTQMNSTTGVDGIISAVDAAVAADEGGLSYHLLSIANGTGAALELVEDEASHQYLLKKGYNHSDLMSIASFALGAGSTDAYISFWQQSEDEATWDMSGDTTIAGLVVRDASGMLSEDILDNVQKVVMTGEQNIDLSGDDLTRLTLNKLTNKEGETTSKLTLEGDATDTVTINNAAYAGTVVLDTLSAVISGTVDTIEAGEGTGITATVKDTTINVNGSGVLLSGRMENGAINIAEEAGVAAASDLKITGTDLNIVYDDKGATTMDTTGMSETGQTLVDLGNMKGTAGDIVIGKDGKNSALLEKYFTNIRFNEKEGAVVADRNTSYFSDNFTAESANGEAGMTLADAALLKLNPQMDKDSALGAMLTAIENAGSTTARDELAASLAGASSAVLGMAVSGDVDRQLRAIRNRTTTMGVDQSVANEDMPYFNAWINAEGSMNELSDNGTEGGYKLNSWGGTVGFD